MCVARD